MRKNQSTEFRLRTHDRVMTAIQRCERARLEVAMAARARPATGAAPGVQAWARGSPGPVGDPSRRQERPGGPGSPADRSISGRHMAAKIR